MLKIAYRLGFEAAVKEASVGGIMPTWLGGGHDYPLHWKD